MLIGPFLIYLQHEKRYAAHTIKSYQADLQEFDVFIKRELNLSITEIKPSHVRSYIAELLKKKKAESSVGRKLSALRSFYKYLVREQLVEASPMGLIKAPKIPKRLPVFVDEGKMDRLLDGYQEVDGTQVRYFDESFKGQRDKLVLELLFGTGIRLAELLNLKESDINFYEGTIKVLGKRSKERIIPLHQNLIRELQHYNFLKSSQQFDNKSNGLIVTNKGADAYAKFIYQIVHQYIGKVSTQDKRSPHVLRHSFASSLLNKGANLNDIKLLLGHTSLAATQVYTHNAVERLKSIYKQAHPKA